MLNSRCFFHNQSMDDNGSFFPLVPSSLLKRSNIKSMLSELFYTVPVMNVVFKGFQRWSWLTLDGLWCKSDSRTYAFSSCYICITLRTPTVPVKDSKCQQVTPGSELSLLRWLLFDVRPQLKTLCRISFVGTLNPAWCGIWAKSARFRFFRAHFPSCHSKYSSIIQISVMVLSGRMNMSAAMLRNHRT